MICCYQLVVACRCESGPGSRQGGPVAGWRRRGCRCRVNNDPVAPGGFSLSVFARHRHWWTAQRCVNAAALVLPDVDRLHVTQLGIDEHRYRRVRWFRDPDTSAWRRVEPWMTTPRQRGIRSGVGCGRRPRQCRRRVLARPPVAGVARPDPDRGDRPVPPGPVGEPVSDARAATPRPGTRSVAAARSTPPGPTGRCCYAATTPSQPGPAIDSSRYSPPTIPPVNSSPPGAVSGSGS